MDKGEILCSLCSSAKICRHRVYQNNETRVPLNVVYQRSSARFCYSLQLQLVDCYPRVNLFKIFNKFYRNLYHVRVHLLTVTTSSRVMFYQINKNEKKTWQIQPVEKQRILHCKLQYYLRTHTRCICINVFFSHFFFFIYFRIRMIRTFVRNEGISDRCRSDKVTESTVNRSVDSKIFVYDQSNYCQIECIYQ